MKVILFLAAVYSLIINQYSQKKVVVYPLPAPAHMAKPIAGDSIRKISTFTTAWYQQQPPKQTSNAREFSVIAPSW